MLFHLLRFSKTVTICGIKGEFVLYTVDQHTCSESFHGDGWIGHSVWIARCLDVLGFPPGSVFVFGMILHVFGSDSFGLVNERTFFGFRQRLPFGAKTFGNLRVVHLWILLSDLSSLHS